jgi:protein O-mannosyl-transferase
MAGRRTPGATQRESGPGGSGKGYGRARRAPDRRGHPRPAGRRWFWIVPAILAAIAYLPTLGNSFVWDDVNFIVDNPAAHHLSDLPSALSRGYGWVPSGATGPDASIYFRPVVTLANTVTWTISGGRPGLFHLHNLLAHAATAGLLAILASMLGLSQGAALLVGACFALHPASSEAVAWISGRTDVFAAFFTLLSLVLLVGWRSSRLSRWPKAAIPALVSASVFLALASKESAAVLLVLVPLVLLRPGRLDRMGSEPAAGGRTRGLYAAWIASAAGAGLYLILRFGVLGAGALGGRRALPDRGDLLSRALLGGNLLLSYLARLIVPRPLTVEPPPALTQAHPPVFLGLLGLLLLLAAGSLWLLWIRRRSSAPAVVLGLGLFLLGLLPVLQFISTGEIYGERFLYLPSAGLFLLLGSLSDGWLRRGGGRAWIVLAVLGLPWVILLQARLPAWKDELSLFSSAVRVHPQSARALANLGSAQSKLGLLAEADKNLAEAVRLDPKDPWKHAQYGSLLVNLGRAEEGTRELESVWAGGLRSRTLRKNLGIGWIRTGRYAEAAQILQEAVDLDPQDPSLVESLAMAERKLGNRERAAALLRRELQMAPARPSAWLNLIGVLLEDSKADQAREVGARFLQQFPDAPQAEDVRKLLSPKP